MTSFLLVRHGTHDLINTTITGRMAGVHLNETGRAEAECLAEQLSSLPIRQIYCGPLERARETAEPLGGRLKVPVQIEAKFNEVEVGEWTGHTFQELAPRQDWQNWNQFRSNAAAPGGERMLEVQLRALGALATMHTQQQGLTAIFTHGDVIRSIIAYYLGIPLDLFLRISIDPVSVTFLQLYDASVSVRCVNATGAAAALRAQ
ncbi:MAG: histidine phosphatase family protein [Chthoniobacterales bacterium]